jgi:hypothetical protein
MYGHVIETNLEVGSIAGVWSCHFKVILCEVLNYGVKYYFLKIL